MVEYKVLAMKRNLMLGPKPVSTQT